MATVSPPRPTRPRYAVVAVAVVAVAALVTGIALQLRPSGRPEASPEPSTAASSPAVTAEPSPDGDWTAVELADLPAVASLEPVDANAAGIDPKTTFRLATLTDEPVDTIAARLTVSPAVELRVDASADGRSAVLTPGSALTAGATYRFAVRTTDGLRAGSWAFNVRGPVNVTSTIPGDSTTQVPVNAGIEVTFDQDGVADMRDHFLVEPAIDGRFERHGRTQVFVPDRPLAAETLYTVTVGRGLARTGTDLTLLEDVVFQFETAGRPPAETTWLEFGRDVLEVPPNELPVLAVNAVVPEALEESPPPVPETADVVVYRLPTVEQAGNALTAFLTAPRWTDYADPLVPTERLAVVSRFRASLESLGDSLLLLRFPARLDRGWYVVELPGEKVVHAFLQVTPLSAWVAVLDDRTVVWVNDTERGDAVAGARVAVEGGAEFARSDADGLAIAATPRDLVPAAAVDDEAEAAPTAPVLRVTAGSGDAVLVPFNVAGYGDAYRGEWYEKVEPADMTWWSLAYTDRGMYRQDDTIGVWGYLRARDDGSVPAAVDIRLVATERGEGPTLGPPIVSTTVSPGADGAFSVPLAFRDLALGSYRVQVVVGGRVIVSRWIDVTVIRKPPYRLVATADQLAVIEGTRVTWTTAATFFDGTPAPSLDLRWIDYSTDREISTTTDAAGQATIRTTPTVDDDMEDGDRAGIYVEPAGPESSEISAGASVLVFPSAYDLRASSTLDGRRLTVTGRLRAIDLAAAERQIREGAWDVDAGGKAVVGEAVRLAVTELIPVRREVGTEYDFVEKVVEPRYEYDIERRAVETLTVRTGADGRLRAVIDVPSGEHEYEVVLTATDGADRVQRRTAYAGPAVDETYGAGVLFETSDGQPAGEDRFAIGEEIRWRISDDGEPFPDGGGNRYLYLTAQRGLRTAFVSTSATLEHAFEPGDAPGIFVIGVRFTGGTYAPKAAAWAMFDETERELTVTVSADKVRYAPGDTATLTVSVADADGRPLAASVLLEAVDEKLFAMGGAEAPAPLGDLYQRVDSGILRLTATHQVPGRPGGEGEGGDTTGGGGRSDFEDTLLFRELQTDASGRVTTTVALSDDLTSWHVSAIAVTDDLRAGAAQLLVPVGLPFFVEVTTADTYLVADEPAIRVRAYGSGLRAGDPVVFRVGSESLGLAETTVEGTAFKAETIDLPALSVGEHVIVVRATATSRQGPDGKPLSDGIEKRFEVVRSRLTSTETAYGIVGASVPRIDGVAGLTTYTFSDAGRGRLVPLLVELASTGSSRIDRDLAAFLARDLLVDEFGRDPSTLPPAELDPSRLAVWEGDESDGERLETGIALLPWSSPDPWLAARIAVTAPNAANGRDLVAALVAIRDDDATKRDLAVAAAAGLAAIGEPVLDDLQALAALPDLTVSERIWLALGFAGAGNEPAAAAIERQLLTESGERLGGWVRLRVPGGAEAMAETTAMLAVVAAAIGDPLAGDLAAYVVGNPAEEVVTDLELVAYARQVIEREPPEAVSFAWTVDGRRAVVSLDGGETTSLRLTPDQVETLRIEALRGSVLVTVDGQVAAESSGLDPHPDLTLTRSAASGPFPADRVVTVDLTARFAASAPEGCYEVVELVPSGLAPMSMDDAYGQDESGIWTPVSVVGQEVRFCAPNEASSGDVIRMRYWARVVGEGTYRWEPAVMQLPAAPELLAATPAEAVTIGSR